MSRIAEVDMDSALYVGDEDDGVYYDAARGRGGWYASAIVDCNTGHFCGDSILSDDGPYKSRSKALEAGFNAGAEWCMTNEVLFSEAQHGETV